MLAALLVFLAVWGTIVVVVVALCVAARRTDDEVALDEAIVRPGELGPSERRSPSGTPS